MAFVVKKPSGAWELREARSTEAGPRSRTLAGFRTLTPEVVEHALERAEQPLAAADVVEAATRAGAPVARNEVNAAAARLLAAVASAGQPSLALRRLLAGALEDPGGEPTDSELAAAPWAGASAEQRGEALRDLLLLADRLPPPRRPTTLRFPRFATSAP